ncbi:MAG: hypothetical protein ABFC24_06965 [Methanoregulaceae archaeon]
MGPAAPIPAAPVSAPVAAPGTAVPAVPGVQTPGADAGVTPQPEPPKTKPVRSKIKLITKEEQEEFRLLDIDPTPKARRKPVYRGEPALARAGPDPELLGEKKPEPDIWEEEPAWEDDLQNPEPAKNVKPAHEKAEPDIWESDEEPAHAWEPEEPEPEEPVYEEPEPRYVSYEEEEQYEPIPEPPPPPPVRVRRAETRSRQEEVRRIEVPPRAQPPPRELTESERRAGGRGITRISDSDLMGVDRFTNLGRERKLDTSHSSAVRTPAKKKPLPAETRTTRFREESSLGVRVARDSKAETDTPQRTGTKTERFSGEPGLGAQVSPDAFPEEGNRKRMGVKTEYFPEDDEEEFPEKPEYGGQDPSVPRGDSVMGADRMSDSKGKRKIGKFYDVDDLTRDPTRSDR